VLAGAVVLAFVGLCDDRFSLPVGVRVAAQLAVAIAVVLALGGLERAPLPPPLDWPLGALGTPLAALWVVAVVNFFNFLDGIDGLATLQAVVTGAGIAIAAWDPSLSLVAGALAGAAAGFLPFNWARASVFLGDVGSYFLGFALAALPLGAVPEWRSRAVLFVALSLWLFLADATWTLTRRGLRGARVHEAHREHLYQRLAQRFGHARVTLSIGIASAALTALALLALTTGSTAWAWAALGLAVAFFAAEAATANAQEAA
jgi:Fuc2NAc and GlcNAc transferase